MNEVTLKDFAKSLGVEVKNLYTYIKRGQIVIDADNNVDLGNAINKTFISKRNSKKISSIPKPIKINVAEPSEDDIIDSEISETGILSLDKSTELLQHRRAIKTDLENKKLQIDIEKRRGEVIPSAPIAPIVFQLKQYWLTHAKIAFEKALIEIGHKYEITSDDLAYFRGENTRLINDAMVASTLEFTSNLESIVSQFSIKRSVGERA